MFKSLAMGTGALNAYFLFEALSRVHSEDLFEVARDYFLPAAFENLCQSSISFDVLLTFILSAVFMVNRDSRHGLVALCTMPVLGLASAFAIFTVLELCRPWPAEKKKTE